MKNQNLIYVLIINLFSNFILGQNNLSSDNIRLNQIGFYPNGPKIAIVIGSKLTKFSLIDFENQKDTIFSSNLEKGGNWNLSGEETMKADFSKYTKSGKYVLYVQGLGNSYPFVIMPKVLEKATKASIKGFYYQRIGIELKPQFAGKFARPEGHPDDDKVIVHPSAASAKRPAGTIISSSKGWYDAGDYNKYIVNSGISTYTLLALFEDFSSYTKTLNLTIPESKNAIPDLIDEVNWNLRWMLTMQDPEDGGVYHKLTNAKFDKFIMPNEATTPRYVVMKSTAAALDFAALMAQASRIYKKYPKELPGLSDSCRVASVKAYFWAKKNPKVYYQQQTLANPKIETGAYGDTKLKDEFYWASCELFIATGDEKYLTDSNVGSTISENINIPSWGNVGMLGVYSMVRNADKFAKNKKISTIINQMKTQFIAAANVLQQKGVLSPYGIPMGVNPKDFAWGSNAVASNQGMFLIKAYLLSKDQSLVDSAQANADYLLGRNALGFSFLTGFGIKSPQNIHHRISFSDGITEPVPGLLVGGPNPGQQDLIECNGITYSSKIPAKSYLDVQCAYASNEVAINWNAPLVYLLGGLEAVKTQR
ncbi:MULTISPECIES: glycoside hydrolase family 9 protein [unclassified Flavobacterium]|jgi:endoglucanase|uniref:glycoside hydrolase family 9 protein n=1 Tax=unclassified Flavobacterium TaxID=196869 RepID=UPI0025BE6F27|nr:MULTISPECIES: glycoside hydrolase family 9 protein [unclassified Flavobacterium]